MSLPLQSISLKPGKSPKNASQRICMTSRLIQKFHLKINQDVTISIGKKSVSLVIETAESAADEIILPEDIFKFFCLPIQAYHFHAVYDEINHHLKLGPVFGLLTDHFTNALEEPNFRNIHMFCEELHQGITDNGGFFFVFSFKDFPQKGYHFHEGKWTSFDMPLPDVIYNRIHSRKIEHSSPFKKFRRHLEELNIPFFNDGFLSKWEVYQHLMKEPTLVHFVPETTLYSKEGLRDFAKKYNSLFIKPVHGSQGKNIIKLMKAENGQYYYQSSLQGLSSHSEKYFSADELHEQIKPLLGNRIYIIQQGIPLLSYQDCSMDFRALCHKNIRNQWQVTSLVARISSSEEFVSNIARGGKILKPLAALQTGMNKNQAKTTIDLIKELSIKTAETISKHSSGITGELGIDIGIDLEGGLHIIEVNFKPSKNFEDGLMKLRPSAKAIIQFCLLLSFDADDNGRNLQ